MKLPEDSKERNKVLILIGIGAAAVLYVLFQVTSTAIRSRGRALQKIEELETNLKTAEREINEAKRNRVRNAEILTSLQDMSTRHFLHPGLGKNYLLGATGEIERLANETGVQIQSITERGLARLPNPGMPDLLRTYSVGVYLLCGFEDALRLVTAIEAANPFITVVNLEISGNASRDPENHTVRFDVRWTTWGDEEVKRKVESFEPLQAAPEDSEHEVQG